MLARSGEAPEVPALDCDMGTLQTAGSAALRRAGLLWALQSLPSARLVGTAWAGAAGCALSSFLKDFGAASEPRARPGGSPG